MGRKTVPLVALLAVLLSIGAYVAWPRHTGGDDLDETDYDGADYDYDADYGDGEFVDDGAVVALTKATFDREVLGRKFALVEFYAPWCGHCKSLAPAFSKAASILRDFDPNVLLAKVDATVEVELAEQFNVEGYPTILFFRKGTPKQYDGGREAEEIVSWIKRKTAPPLKQIDDLQESVAFDDKNIAGYSITGFFPADAPDRAANIEKFKAAAAELEETFLVTYNPEVAARWQVPTDTGNPFEVVLRKTYDEPLTPYSGALDAAELGPFIKREAQHIIAHFGPESQGIVFGTEHQVFYIASATCAEPAVMMVREAARLTRGLSVQMVWVQAEEEIAQQLFEYFSILEDESMAQIRPEEAIVVGLSRRDGQMTKHELKGAPTAESLAAFGRSLADETAPVWFKSAPAPEVNDGPVTVVVGTTFDEIVMDRTKDVLLEVYAPWCGHCQKLEPVYTKLGKRYASVPSVVIAKMDGTANEHAKLGGRVEGYPTILMFPAVPEGAVGEKPDPISYEGDQTLISLTRFIKSHATLPYELPKKTQGAGGPPERGGDGEGEAGEQGAGAGAGAAAAAGGAEGGAPTRRKGDGDASAGAGGGADGEL